MYIVKTMGMISSMVIFVFAYAKSRFSHEALIM